MKRVVIFVLSLGLLIAAPAPVSLCAMLSSMATECAPVQSPARCDQMDMDTSAGASLTANTTSCCTNTQAPLPEAKSGWQELSPASGPAIVPVVRASFETRTQADPTIASRDVSESPGQSFLCTFLI